MLEASTAGVLFNLEIAVDDDGHPYLLGLVASGGEQIVLVSRSFAEVEPEEES